METRHLHVPGAALLLLAALGLAWHGQPGPQERWQFIAPELEPRLTHRQVQIEPAELAQLMRNDYIDLAIIDVRDERDWNLFHLWGAERIPREALFSHRKRFANLPPNGVLVFVSNDEIAATEAWKLVMASAIQPNAYILAGGINRWLAEFAPGQHRRRHTADESPDETLRYPVKKALGSRHPAALPDPHHMKELDFTRRVKLKKRITVKGGCG